MVRDLVRDEAVLSKRCQRATAEDAAVAQDLVDTVATIDDAACLAANQIGVCKAVCVYLDDERNPHVLYNPRLMMGLKAFRVEEGCLTRDEPSKVTRYTKVKVAYEELHDDKLVERKRDFTGWTAEMVQHMIDHCNGKLV